MPYKRRAYGRKKTGKKPYAKRSGYKKRSTRRSKGGPGRGYASAPFPATLYTTLTYVDDINLQTVAIAGVPALREYRGNDIYDPDLTGVGAQPKYTDTLLGDFGGNAPYSKYTVMGSQIIVDIMPDPTLASTADLMQISVMPIRKDTGSDFIDVIDMTERPFSRSRLLGNTGSKAVSRLTYYASTKQMFAGTNTNSVDFSGSWNATVAAAYTWRWQIGVVNLQPGVITKCYTRVRIKYFVQLTSLNQVAKS